MDQAMFVEWTSENEGRWRVSRAQRSWTVSWMAQVLRCSTEFRVEVWATVEDHQRVLEAARRAWAPGLEALRVKAKMRAGGESSARRARSTAPPCLPVAPTMRTVLGAI